MAMNAKKLKADLKTDLLSIFDTSKTDSGISEDEYADKVAQAIAQSVVEHIKTYAVVNTNVIGTAGPYPITATGTGGVS